MTVALLLEALPTGQNKCDGRRPPLQEKSFFRLSQFREHTEILKHRRISGNGLATRDLLQKPAHDFSAARFGQSLGKPDFIGLGDPADVNTDMIAQVGF